MSLWNIKRLITKYILWVPGITITLWESQLQCLCVFVFSYLIFNYRRLLVDLFFFIFVFCFFSIYGKGCCLGIWFKVLFRIRIVLSYSLYFCSLLGLFFSDFIWWTIEYLHLYIIIIIFIIINISHITMLDSTLSKFMKVKVSVLKYFAISIIHWPTSKVRCELNVFFSNLDLNKNV